MKSERKKALELGTELVSYFLEHQIEHLNVDFEFTNEYFSVSVSGRTPVEPSDLDQMAAALHEGRQPEMDEYYDQLLGSFSHSQGYHLWGAMVDEAEVHYKDETLFIKIWQKKN